MIEKLIKAGFSVTTNKSGVVIQKGVHTVKVKDISAISTSRLKGIHTDIYKREHNAFINKIVDTLS